MQYFQIHCGIILLFLVMGFNALSQVPNWKTGVGLQGYPTGYIPSIFVEKDLGSSFTGEVRIGFNFVRHRDLGKHDDERGGGFGGSLGVNRYFGSRSEWAVGLRTDLWFNDVDWKDNPHTQNAMEGTSDVIVLQPTAVAGRVFALPGGNWSITPTLALGIEWNVRTNGEPVGEGLIGLLGIRLGWLRYSDDR